MWMKRRAGLDIWGRIILKSIGLGLSSNLEVVNMRNLLRLINATLFSLFIVLICCFQEVLAAPPMKLGDAEIVSYRHWEIWLSSDFKETKDEKMYKPTLEIIYGVIPRLELAIEGSYIFEDKNGDRTEGLDALAIQPKFFLVEEKELNPAVALQLLFEVPTDEEKNSLDWSESAWAPALYVQKHFGNTLVITGLKYFLEKKLRYGIDVMYAMTKSLKLVSEVYAEHFIHSDKMDELNFRVGFKYNFLKNAKVYFAGGRSLHTVKANRPQFEANGGIMVEF
jgi:hypothetical protein